MVLILKCITIEIMRKFNYVPMLISIKEGLLYCGLDRKVQ